MSSDSIITVEGLGKRYRLGASRSNERYTALRDVISDKAKNLFRRNPTSDSGSLPSPSASREEFWALKDVNFEVKRGEVLGIIGRNGAGKSTLLKILSRITEPTEGRIRIRGRVASLLEVGTGFHPELTGRENIYLNGAILGMHRHEIKAKFDEIVAFAEVEKFLDTPVKRYSSGMYVRLAFAVAAHLEPEILIVDEVLAVGDAEFQKKCLGKMQEVAHGQGRTVLFVSHQMAAVQSLCKSAILLEEGQSILKGKTEKVILRYSAKTESLGAISLSKRVDRAGSGEIRFTMVSLQNGRSEAVRSFVSGHKAVLRLTYLNFSKKEVRNFRLDIRIDSQLGQRLVWLSTTLHEQPMSCLPAEATTIALEIESLPLIAGRYVFTIFAECNGSLADWVKDAGWFDVDAGNYYNSGKLPQEGQGDFLVRHRFAVF
ncbi:MAG: ABC transporter ATP-binding protein [Acidobacteriota bacterium]|nr:ABC transporter ATP-binding protein [Acidobacteriota bacterium]